MPTVPILDPSQAAEALAAGRDDFILLDVREAEELRIVAVAGAVHIPMQDIPASLDRLRREDEIAVLCHSGQRSHAVASYLQAQGYGRAANVVGGIDRWATTVDASLRRY